MLLNGKRSKLDCHLVIGQMKDVEDEGGGPHKVILENGFGKVRNPPDLSALERKVEPNV